MMDEESYINQLVQQIQIIIDESGGPAREISVWDAREWLMRFLDRPLMAFGSATPRTCLHTPARRAKISRLLAQAQSGAPA